MDKHELLELLDIRLAIVEGQWHEVQERGGIGSYEKQHRLRGELRAYRLMRGLLNHSRYKRFLLGRD